jgi:FAD/FMN-containing dehydrogenase
MVDSKGAGKRSSAMEFWKHNGEIVHALVGSANFSTNGLTTPYREILAETTRDTFKPLDDYITKDYYVQFEGLAEKHYKVTLDGLFNHKLINMDYSLKAQRFPSHICTIEDNISIQGHVNGPFTRLRIRGEGSALDGNVSYDGIKVGNTFENVNIYLKIRELIQFLQK